MDKFFILLVQITIMSSIITIGVLLISRVFSSRLNTKIILFLWMIVLVRLITPIIIDSPIHFEEIIPTSIESPTIVSEEADNNFIIDTNNADAEYIPAVEENTADVITIEDTQAIDQPKETIGFIESIINYIKRINISYYIIAVWFLGAYIMTFKKIGASYRFAKIIKSDDEIELTEILNECRHRLGYYKKVTIKTSKHINTPIVIGCINPTILLPESLMKNISKDKLLFIIMHEISHIKRNDIIKNYLWMIARIIHWFNPFVHIAYKMYLENVEIACDQMVVDNISNDERFEYSQSLLDVIKLSQSKVLLSAQSGMSFCEDNSKIRKRVERMFNTKKHVKSAGIVSLIFAFLMIFCCFTTACLPNTDEIVTTGENDSADDAHIYNVEIDGQRVDYETLNIVYSYAMSENPLIMYMSSTRLEDGDICAAYNLDNNTVVKLRRSDNTLLGLHYNDRFINDVITFNEDEAKEIAKEVIEEYITVTEFNVTNVGIGETSCRVDGILKKYEDRLYDFSITINANKELVMLDTTPIGVEGVDGTLTIEESVEYAVEFLKTQGYTFIDTEYITLLDTEKNPFVMPDAHYIKLSYEPEEPSTENYPFTAELYINIFSGEVEGATGINIVPDFDNVDMISVEDAIKIARERILIAYDLEDYKLVTKEVNISAATITWYHITFIHTDTEQKYYVNLNADTGEIADRGRYAEGYEGNTYENQQKWLDTAYGYLMDNYADINDKYLYLRDCYMLSYDGYINKYVVKYHYKPEKLSSDDYDFDVVIAMDFMTHELIELIENPIG